LDSNRLNARFDDLCKLQNGWLDGHGVAPSPQGLRWLAQCIESYYHLALSPFYLYPTAEGGVQVEWSLGTHEITLEIDLERRGGEWHSLDTRTQEVDWKVLDLGQPGSWAFIAAEVDRTGTDAKAPRTLAEVWF
jgi:hypothetical protein